MLRKIILLPLILIFLSINPKQIYCQNIDSLKSLLTNVSDSEKAKIYLQIGEAFANDYHDSALIYYNKAEEIAKDQKLSNLLVDILNSQAIVMDELGYILEAKEKIDTALSIVHDSVQRDYLTNNLAIIYSDMGLYDRAYKIFLEKLKQYKKNKDSSGISGIYSNLSNIFMEMEKYDSVIFYNQQAYKIDSAIKDTFGIIIDYLNIGIAYTHKKFFSRAKNILFKALYLSKKSHKEYMYPDIFNALGDLYYRENQKDSAFHYLQLAKQLNKKQSYYMGLYYTYMALAKLYLNDNPRISEKYLDSAAIYIKNSPLTDIRDYFQLRYQIFAKLGEYDSAFYYIQKYYATKDSINFVRQKYAIEVARLDAKIKQAQLQIKKSVVSLKKQEKKSKFYSYIALTALIFTIFFIYLLLKINKKQKELAIANAKLKEARARDEIQLTLYKLQKKAASIGIDTDLNKILEILLKELVNISWLRLENKAIIFLTENGEELYMAASVNIDDNIKKMCNKVKAGQCLCGQALKESKTIIEKEITPEHINRYEGMHEHGHYVAPIYVNKKLLGVLCLYLSAGYKLSQHEIQFMEQFMILLSNIIDRKLKTEKIKSTLEKQDQLNQKLFAQSLLLEQQKMTLERTTKKLAEQSQKLDKALKDIKSSITYTSYIVNTLLPSEEYLKKLFKEFFLIFKPIEEIGGDFYYAKKIDNKIYFAVGDATGHGVPGAFLASHAIFFINDILNKNSNINASDILTKLRIEIKRIFEKTQNFSMRYSSIDIAFCIIDLNTNTLNYSGAFIPLIYIRNNKLHQIKAVRSPIGLYIVEKEYKDHFIELQENDVLYIQSDGFADQLSIQHYSKFTIKRYENILLKIHHLPMEEQKQILLKEFEQWKGEEEQTDDITILGIRWHIK